MKFLKIFSVLSFLAAMWTSCENDIDPKVPSDAVAPALTAPTEGGTYVFEKVDESNVFQTFQWTNADFKMDVVATYALQVDEAGGDFSNHKFITQNVTSPLAITIADFNKGLLGAGFEDGVAHHIKVRILAGNYLASEAIEMTVTPYFDAEPWSIIGSAVGGWNTENDQYMNYDKNTAAYSLTLDLKAGEYKFRAPKKNSDPWKYNYGLDGGSVVYENATNVSLKSGGDNIKTLGGNYTITFDVVNERFSIVQNSASSMTNWTGVALDAVGTGISADNANATDDASSWNWGNVLVADNNGEPSMDAAVYTWTWKGVVLEADEGFKIRTLNGVAPSNGNGVQFDAGYSALDAANSSSKVADLGGNLSVTEKGTYDITITIDANNGDTKTITIKDPYPSQLYMIGDAVGTWNWPETDMPMVPVHSQPHQFWKIVWLNGAGGFKFSPEKAWGNDFGAVSDSAGEGEFGFGSSNVGAPATAGYYMVVVDYNKKQIAVSPVKVYLMGDCVGGWTAGVAGNLFTVDNANSVVTITKALSPGNLRMYAWHDWFSDWWQSEFNVMNSQIVLRGTGGDQDAVPLTAATYKIDLNFKTMDGAIAAQ
ncbi:MAG: SusF/SusE family outer membrane protein [Breznakibacter sp.]